MHGSTFENFRPTETPYMPLSKQELNRKLFHLAALALPAVILYFPKWFLLPEWISCLALAALSGVILGIELIRFKFPTFQALFHKLFRSMLRPGERVKLTGSTWYILGALTCSIVFYGAPHISFMALFMFILGDATAAIVGLSIGGIKIGNKTLEGSLGCFFACVLTGAFIFPHVPLLLIEWNGRIPLGLLITASLSMTVFELIPIKIDGYVNLNDNISVPVIGGMALKYLYPFFTG